MTQTSESGKRSLITKIHERTRYHLVIQEILDRMAKKLGVVFYPYLLIMKQLDADSEPIVELECGYRIRYLSASDMSMVAQSRGEPSSLQNLIDELQSSRCLALFLQDKLVAYCWYQLDRVPELVWGESLFELQTDEAYKFDLHVTRSIRGQRLGILMNSVVNQELIKLNRKRAYTIILASNSSSRKLQNRFDSERIELRLLAGFKWWRGFDIRLRTLGSRVRAPFINWVRAK